MYNVFEDDSSKLKDNRITFCTTDLNVLPFFAFSAKLNQSDVLSTQLKTVEGRASLTQDTVDAVLSKVNSIESKINELAESKSTLSQSYSAAVTG